MTLSVVITLVLITIGENGELTIIQDKVEYSPCSSGVCGSKMVASPISIKDVLCWHILIDLVLNCWCIMRTELK